jgi:4-amino-4-deoxy-L-arabinose transferase-like glycosyltransferase
MNKDKYFNDRNAIIFLFLIAVFHTLYNGTIQLNVDEAYYWLWSRKLQLSYYDHPPMIAYIIRIFTFCCDSEIFVRAGAVVCMSFSAWYLYLLAKDIYGNKTAWLTLFTGAILPATNMGYTIITPDAPLVLFWTTSTYYSYKALFNDKWSDYIKAGISIGLLMLSKYTSVLFLGFLLIYILWKMPEKFLKLKPWVAIIIAFVIFSPVIIWNYRHDWISFTFQYTHGSSKDFRVRWDKFFEFVGGLFVIFTPIFFGILLYGTFKYKDWYNDKKKFYVTLSYLFPLIFFLYKALFKKMELNWVGIAFIPGLLVFADTVVRYNFRRLYITGASLATIATVFILFPSWFFLPPNLNIHNRISGYKEVIMHIQKKNYIKKDDALFGDRLNRAAIFTYYVKGHPMSHIPTPSRFSSYTLWDKGLDFSKMRGIYLAVDDSEAKLKKVFPKVKLLEKYEFNKKGFAKKIFYIYRCN